MTTAHFPLDGMHDIEMLLHSEIGLDASTVGSSLVERAVRRRMENRGIATTAAYSSRLAQDGRELQELVEEVVVPETYFFREPDALVEMAHRAAAMHPHPTSAAPLRILSIPCSSGEEPYSIAMALISAGLDASAIAIDAVDVSLEALARAREGTYRDGSFRGDTGVWKEFFHEEARGWKLDSEVRELVHFASGNLVSPAFQPPRGQYDFIFCRNLLIYFDAGTQTRALANLRPLLAPEGVLVVGSADSFAVRRAGFEPVPGCERSFLFRLSREPAPVPATTERRLRSMPATLRRAPGPPRRGVAQHRTIAPASMPVKLLESNVASRGTSALQSRLAEIARLANDGKLADALAVGEDALRDGLASSELLALMGTTLAAIPDLIAAEACYRRALFLEPDNEDALLHLSCLLDRRGETALASRLRARAQRARGPNVTVRP